MIYSVAQRTLKESYDSANMVPYGIPMVSIQVAEKSQYYVNNVN